MTVAGYAVVRTLVLLGLGLSALALSVVASVWGLTAVLVAAALVGLVVLRAGYRARHATDPAGRPYRAFAMTAVLLVGFFVLLTVASQVWPH
ncbi:MAG TPA: hypothetical protein VGZ23_03935 [bacterium]|nr:hypothetical protein [bacterium]